MADGSCFVEFWTSTARLRANLLARKLPFLDYSRNTTNPPRIVQEEERAMSVWELTVAVAHGREEADRCGVTESPRELLEAVWNDAASELSRLASAMGLPVERVQDVLQDVYRIATKEEQRHRRQRPARPALRPRPCGWSGVRGARTSPSAPPARISAARGPSRGSALRRSGTGFPWRVRQPGP